MKRRTLCALLCVLLLLDLAAPAARAADLYFLAAEESIQPLSGASMPFWSNGYLYVPSSVFAREGRWDLSVSDNSRRRVTVIYRRQTAQLFYWDRDYSEDNSGSSWNTGARVRGGTVFVPAALVADRFNLSYSVTGVSHGYLVWLRLPDFGMSEQEFSYAATYSMNSRYEEYMRTEGAAQGGADDPSGGQQGVPVKQVYLCLAAGEETSAQLTMLERRKACAAFFCTPEFLEEQGDLLRRMGASGQAVGILADAGAETPVAEQLERGNAALLEATCGKTRLTYILNDRDSAAAGEMEAAGWYCLRPGLDRTNYRLGGSANALSLRQRITLRTGDVTVWLGDTASAVGLLEFARTAEQAGWNCRALRETV